MPKFISYTKQLELTICSTISVMEDLVCGNIMPVERIIAKPNVPWNKNEAVNPVLIPIQVDSNTDRVWMEKITVNNVRFF